MNVKSFGGIVVLMAVISFQSTYAVAGAPNCSGDTNDDGWVNVNDLTNVILQWGPCVGCSGDTNGDDVVNVNDLTDVILQWGVCPPNTCPWECGDPLGCIFGGGVIADGWECEMGGVCCEPAQLDPCPFACMDTPYACYDMAGVEHSDFECVNDGVCCELPPLDPCPYDCVSDSFECDINGGTIQTNFQCSSSGVCCSF